MAELEEVGGKAAGQLIQSTDWNDLVQAIIAVRDDLTSQVDQLQLDLTASLQGVNDRLDGLGGRVDALEATVNHLRQQFRVTLETEKSRFAMGELAQVTARVTDFEGNPLDLSNASTRPWIDFIGSWGQLRPAGGFNSRGGASDRSISVQVNGEGIAQVLLRAEHAGAFSTDDENEMAATLSTRIGNAPRTVSEIILESATPMEAHNAGAFSVMTQEYDRADTHVFRDYVDAYYLYEPATVAGVISDPFFHRWRDYRATLMAMVKDDSEPTTADQGRGYASIQVTFRDWVGPWINLDYLSVVDTVVENYRELIVPGIAGSYAESIAGIQDRVTEIVGDHGLIGRVRDYQIINKAMSTLALPEEPEFLDPLVRYTQNFLEFQKTMEYSQANTVGGARKGVAMSMFVESAVQNNAVEAALDAKIGAIRSDVVGAREELGGLVSNAVDDFAGKVDATEQRINDRANKIESQLALQEQTVKEHTSSLIMLDERTQTVVKDTSAVRNQVATVSNQVQMLESFDVINVQNDLARLGEINANLTKAQEEIVLLKARVGGSN